MNENAGLFTSIVLLVLGAVTAMALLVLKRRKVDIQPDTKVAIEKRDAEHVDFIQIGEIEIVDPIGNRVAFQSLNPNEMDVRSKYTEVIASSSAITSGLIKTLPSLSIAELSSGGPIFRATGKISELVMYKDGTTSSIVSKAGKSFDSHAGFKMADLSKLNVAAAVGASMQIMAAISGQYYMSQITKRLDGIGNEVKSLVEFHHDEKLGRLKGIQGRVKEISIKAHVDFTDIQALQSDARDADNIAKEYVGRFQAKISNEEFTNITERKLFSKFGAAKDMKALISELENEELGLTVQVAMIADSLLLELKKAEYATRLKLGEANKASEVLGELSRIHENSFLVKAPEMLDSAFTQIRTKADELIADQWIESSKASRSLELIIETESKLKAFAVQFSENDNFDELEKSDREELEILYVPNVDGNEPRVFISEKL